MSNLPSTTLATSKRRVDWPKVTGAATVLAGLTLTSFVGVAAARTTPLLATQPTRLELYPARALPMAARHLPRGCDAVVHVSFAAKGGKRALLEQLGFETPAGEVGLLAKSLAAIDVDRDLDDALVCMAMREDKIGFAIVAGGSVPGDAIVPALEGAGKAIARTKLAGEDFALLEVDGERWLAGQAPDGAILFGNDDHLLTDALSESDAVVALGLPLEAAFAVRANPTAAAGDELFARGLGWLEVQRSAGETRRGRHKVEVVVLRRR